LENLRSTCYGYWLGYKNDGTYSQGKRTTTVRGYYSGIPYYVGRKYTLKGRIACCARGYHFFTSLRQAVEYISPTPWLTLALVERGTALNSYHDRDKSVSNTRRIIAYIDYNQETTETEDNIRLTEEEFAQQLIDKGAWVSKVAKKAFALTLREMKL
jgi:hypothetical protein